MKAGVIGKHQWHQVEFPVQCAVIAKASQVFSDGFVSHLSLAVALRMVRWLVPNLLNKSSLSFVQNSLPWSVMRSKGIPKRQNHLEKMVSATVLASLLGRGTNLTYFVRASVMHQINFLPQSIVFKGPKWSAWTRWFGSVGCVRG